MTENSQKSANESQKRLNGIMTRSRLVKVKPFSGAPSHKMYSLSEI